MKVTTKVFDIVCILAVAGLLLAAPGCSGSREEGSKSSGAKPESQPRKEKAGGFAVPAEGTPGERIKKLWEATGPVMKTDAQGNLVDKEYQEKRTPLFSVWVMLQGKLSLAEQKDEKAQRVIPEVLKFIDNLYGFPGFNQDRREKDREIAKKFFDKRFTRLDEQIRALK